MNTTWKAVLFASGSAVVAGLTYHIMKKPKKPSSRMHEILFYGASAGDAESIQLKGHENLARISAAVLGARSDVCVCVPRLSRRALCDALLAARDRGVPVRVVLHSCDDHAQPLRLALRGAQVKIIEPDVALEHEFMLVNSAGCEGGGEPLAVLGALDYEEGHVNLHSDSTLLTSDRAVLGMLRMEFDRIWHSADSTERFLEDLRAQMAA